MGPRVIVGLMVILSLSVGYAVPRGPVFAAEAQPVTIEYWHIFSETFGGPSIRDVVNRFNASQSQVRVVEKFQPGSYVGLLTNLQAAIAARRPPAVAVVGYSAVDYVMNNFPFVPAAQMPGVQEILNSYSPKLLALGGQKDGKQQGLPYSLSVPVIYYNADLFKAAGLDPDKFPTTWDGVLQAALAIKARTGKFGLMLWNGDTWLIQGLVESNGGRFLSTDNKTVMLNSAAAKEALQFYSDLINVHKVTPLITFREAEASFYRGEIAMQVASIGALQNYLRSSNFDVRTAAWPSFGTKQRRVAGGGNVLFAFATDPKDQAAAWKFIRFLLSSEGITLWTTGTGYVPVIARVAEAQKIKPPHPLVKPSLETLAFVVRWQNFPGTQGLQAERTVLDAVNAFLSGKTTVSEALDDASRKITEIIRQ